MTRSQKGMLAGFSGNFIFGLSFLFSTRAFAIAAEIFAGEHTMPGADVPAMLAVRFSFAFLLMTLMLPLLKIKLDFRGKPVWKLVLLGFFQPVIYFIGESFGLKQTGIVVSSVMIALVPVVCQLFSALLLREAPNALQVVFCVLSIVGVIIVTTQGGDSGQTYLGESFGLKQTGIVVSSVMIALVPVVCQLFSALLLREAPNALQVVFCVLSIVGVIIVTTQGGDSGQTYLTGLIFLTVAVLAAVAFNLLSRSISTVFTPFERTYFMFIDAAVFFGLYALITTHFDVALILRPLIYPDYVVSILYLGGLSSVFAYLMVNYANTYLPLTRSTVFSGVITVVSTTAGFLVGEPCTALGVFACLMIMVGIYGVQWAANKDIKRN